MVVFPEERTGRMATAVEEWIAQGVNIGKQEGFAIGKQEGFAIGRREGLLVALRLGLAVKFGGHGLLLLPAMSEVQDPEVLYTLCEGIKVAQNLTELRELFAALTNPDP
jgi:hypothetical protein